LPLRTIKKDNVNSLSLEWVLQVKNYKLDLDKNRCIRCQICALACPKEAIKTEKQLKRQGEKSQKAKVDIDLAKCNFCGICDILCPFGAIKLTIDGQRMLSVVDKKSFPTLTRHIQANPKAFAHNRNQAEEACPLKLIKVTYATTDGKTVENPQSLAEPERSWVKANVSIDKEHCPCCTVCETKLPSGAIEVRKFLSGKIRIDQTKCPPNCTDCLETCPITGALYLSNADNKVYTNEAFCVYCGACKTVCPVADALELKRTHINHTPVRSGAWNKALERLTSATDLTKELKTRSSSRARDSVMRRVKLEAEQHA
jgi:4Fe-4S ferredoxin